MTIRPSFQRQGALMYVALSLLAASCSGTSSVSDPSGDGTGVIELALGDGNRIDASSLTSGDLEPVVSGDNALAFNLLRLAGRSRENTFLSPYSVATALAMLLPGSEGDTAAEIALLFLHPPMTPRTTACGTD